MRILPEQPQLTRKKCTVSYPGEIEPEVQERLKALGMTYQQYIESLMAFDMSLEKAHIMTGPHIKAGREDAWKLWREIIAEYGNPKKKLVAYFEMFLERLMKRAMDLRGRAPDVTTAKPTQNNPT